MLRPNQKYARDLQVGDFFQPSGSEMVLRCEVVPVDHLEYGTGRKTGTTSKRLVALEYNDVVTVHIPDTESFIAKDVAEVYSDRISNAGHTVVGITFAMDMWVVWSVDLRELQLDEPNTN